MKAMTPTCVIIGTLLATCYGQLIYPDEYNQLIRTTEPPVYLSTPNREMPTVSRKKVVTYNTPQLDKAAPSQLEVPLGAAVSNITPAEAQAPPSVAMSSRVPGNALQDWGDHVNKIITDGVLKFALDMEREIYKTRSLSVINQPDNIVFSPISLAMTLAIVLAGSAGRTFQEVSKVLGLESGVDISRNSEIVHQMFGVLLTQLRRKIIDVPGPRIDLATATYVQDGYPILEQFRMLSTNVYENQVINVDFVKNGKSAQDMINDWVKQKTMGKIPSILNDVPGPETKAIFLSALYFSGEWNQHFLEAITKRREFFIEPNEKINVDMMYNGGTFPFYEDKQLGAKILALPYKGHELSMYMLLPTEKGAKALREFKDRLTVDIIENLILNMKNETCIIGMPRMKLSSSLSLRSSLANLGLRSLFDPTMADLSLMSQSNAVNNVNTVSSVETANEKQGRKSGGVRALVENNDDTLVFTRIGNDDDKVGRLTRRSYFTYKDDVYGYNVQQWTTGFSIQKTRNRRDTANKNQALKPENRNTYTLEERLGIKNDIEKVVNLERNKYRFQEEDHRERSKRQSRPIDEDFLEFVKRRNFPSYGLDDLRNSLKLVNPHVFASDVLHRVEIEITEKGTEAAAATGVILERDGNQKKFVANRPFIFFIRHDPTGLVLFWGTVNSPSPNYPAT